MNTSEQPHNNRKVAALFILIACVVQSSDAWSTFVTCPSGVAVPSVQYYIPPNECYAPPFDTGFQMKQCNTSWGTCVDSATNCDDINTCVRTLTYCLSTITLPTDTTPTGCTLWSAQWSVARTSETGNAYTFSVREDACNYANCAYNEAAKRADINGGARCASQSAVCDTEPTATTPQPTPAPGATTPPPTTTPAPGSVTTDPPTVPLPPGVTVPATTTDPSGTGLPPGVTMSPGATLPPLPSTISKWPSHDNDKFRIVGRTATKSVLDGSTVKDAVAFDFSGVSISFLVSGASFVTIDLAWNRASQNTSESMPHRFAIEVNGTLTTPYTQGIDTNTTNATCCVVNPPMVTYPVAGPTWLSDPNEWYLVTVIKVSEPDFGTLPGNTGMVGSATPRPNWIAYGSVNVTGPDPKFHIVPPPPTTRRVEFVGDSITAGLGNMCNHLPWGSPLELWQNFYYSWASVSCRAFNATCHTSAWSGIGMYRNYNGYTGTTMTDIYQRSLATDPASRWNFTDFKPDAVVINLGTNDMNGGGKRIDGHVSPWWPYVTTNYVDKYVEFVRNVSKHYGNDTQLFLACGPMPWNISNENDIPFCAQVQEVVNRVNSQGIANATYIKMTLWYCLRPSHCFLHPNAEGDWWMAKQATPTVLSQMQWSGDGMPNKIPTCPTPQLTEVVSASVALAEARAPIAPKIVSCTNIKQHSLSDRFKALYDPPQACIDRHTSVKQCFDARTACAAQATATAMDCGARTACQRSFVKCLHGIYQGNNITECEEWHQDFDEAQTFINVGGSYNYSVLQLGCEYMICDSDVIPSICEVNSSAVCLAPRARIPMSINTKSCNDEPDLLPGEPNRLLFPPHECYSTVGENQTIDRVWTTIGSCAAMHALCIVNGDFVGPRGSKSECSHEMLCANTYYRCVVDTVKRLATESNNYASDCNAWLGNITAVVKGINSGDVSFEGSLLQRACRTALCQMQLARHKKDHWSTCGPAATSNPTDGTVTPHAFPVCQAPNSMSDGVIDLTFVENDGASRIFGLSGGDDTNLFVQQYRRNRNDLDPLPHGALIRTNGPVELAGDFFVRFVALFFPSGNLGDSRKVAADNWINDGDVSGSGLVSCWSALAFTVVLAMSVGTWT